MLTDDESQNPPRSRCSAIKLQSEDAIAATVLSPFEQTDILQYWRVVKDHIELFSNDKSISALRNECPTTSGKTFILADSTGAM